MFRDLLDRLTEEQRRGLADRGIGSKRISSWRHEGRLPTEVQVADLADITGAEWAELQKEITVLRAPEERRAHVARALNWRKR